MPTYSIRSGALAIWLAGLVLSMDVRGQAHLEGPLVFATVYGLNTIPDHGGEVVSFLDYREDAYRIVVVDAESKEEQVVETIFYAEPTVSASGQRVAWVGYETGGPADVYVIDLSSGARSRITADAAHQNHVDVSQSILVWQDYRNAGSDAINADIYLHDFESGQTKPVTTDPRYQDLPKTHGRWVIWQDYRHADSLMQTADIYAYDWVVGQERRITEGSFYATHPQVWESLIVWEDYRDGENGEIYLYDLDADEERRITHDGAHQGFPTVSGDWIVWLDYRNSAIQGDLFGFHLPSSTEYPLVVHSAHQDAPHLHQDHLVWQDYRNARFDLLEGRLIDPVGAALEGDPDRPERFTLSAAPNPFSGSITFSFSGPVPASAAASGPLQLAIFDVLGRVVARKQVSFGDQSMTWDGRSGTGDVLPSGAYVALLSRADFREHVVVIRSR